MRSSISRWVVACAAAETIGMTAAALAARIGQDVVDGHGDDARWLALALVVAGGLVEGAALGVLQGRVLAAEWRSLGRAGFALVTIGVAGLGWAAASAPGVLGRAGEGDGPPLGLILLGALGIGLVMGPLLGAVQATQLRHVVAHPWRWVVANAVAWPLAMAVIFLGASTAGADWQTWSVAGYGALTGVLAGAVLGVVSGGWLGSLDGPPVGNRLVLALVAGERFGTERRLVGLALTGRRTGQLVRLPVQYAEHGTELVVVPGQPEDKTWWRNVSTDRTWLWVLDGCGWHTASGRLLRDGDIGHEEALAAYRDRWPRFRPAADQPVVVLRLVGPGIPAVSAGF